MLSSEFLKAVSERNINGVRTQIYTSFTVSPKSNEGEEMVKYAEENIGNALYKEQDNQKLDLNVANWTEEYYKQLLKDLMFNFSRERMNLLRKVRKHLFAGKTLNSNRSKENNGNTNRSSVRFQKTTNNRSNSINYKQTGMVVAGVGGVLLLSGLVAKSFVVGAVGGAVLVAGGIILFNDNN
jgi:hypothetical protein